MISLPVAYELDDVVVMRERGVSVHQWARMVIESFDRLYEDGATSGRLLVLNLHPFVIGQPFRIRHLAAVLAHIVRRPDVWLATGGEVVDWYRRASDDAGPGTARATAA